MTADDGSPPIASVVSATGENEAGPIVWLGILAVTILVLFITQAFLWLVVPVLLAMVLYYATVPLVNRFMHRGVSRTLSSQIIMASLVVFFAVVTLAIVPSTGQSENWQANVERYVEGGMHLVDRTITNIHDAFPRLERVGLGRDTSTRLGAWASETAGRVGGSAALSLLHWIPSLLFVPYLTYFFLIDGHRLKKFVVSGIPNAFFEKTLLLLDRVSGQVERYFVGLLALTLLDTLALGIGLWILGLPAPFLLAAIAGVMSWVPYLGSIAGCAMVILVAATEQPDNSWLAYGALILFLAVRLLDDFVFMPMTVGRSLNVHPVITVLILFLGGAVAGAGGLLLAMPVLGVVMVLGEVFGQVVEDRRLWARHRYAKELAQERAREFLKA